MYKLKNLYRNTGNPAEYVKEYGVRLKELINALDTEAVAKAVDVIEKAGKSGNTIFLIANGGSAATASHFVNDLGPNSLTEGKPGYCVLSLTDNVESVTAIANDAGFENIFSYQLKANMRPGDVVIAMSVSGNSENIIRGIEYARENGGYAIGWTGFEGGRLKNVADLCVYLPTTKDEYGPVEDMFSILAHMISGYLTMKRGRYLHH